MNHEPIQCTTESCTCIDASNHESEPVDNLDLFALRKDVQSCTEHPIGNYVAYDKLFPPYNVFVSTLTIHKFQTPFKKH